jgi:acetolactate synthase I/II/III large subunit
MSMPTGVERLPQETDAVEYRVADYVAEFLHAQGVEQVFEVIGGMITLLVDAIHRYGKTRLLSVHHEQAAAFAAEAAGRITGVPGVAMATSGPGATNLLTGIGSAYFDSSPAVYITGQVNRDEQRGSRPIRQLGFQETDIVTMAAPITKAAWRVTDPDDIPSLLTQAFSLAVEGRPGPVVLDIPMDVQKARMWAAPPQRISRFSAPSPDVASIDALIASLRQSTRPVLLVGGGVRAARAIDQLRGLSDRIGVPTVNSLLAVDVIPYENPLRVGMLGSYGNRWANLAIGSSDFLLVLGSRLDIRQTGADTAGFKADRTIFHVDCDSGELNNRVLGCETIAADLGAFIRETLVRLDGQPIPDWGEWRAEVEQLRDTWPDTAELSDIPGINPNVFMHQLSAASPTTTSYVTDVGQHQMWAAQSLELGAEQRFITSGGMGAMGFGLPAAIGVACASPGRPVVMIAGDGGFQLNIQELQTVARNQLPIKVVILDNGCHGMVRQFQESYFEGRYPSTYWGYSAPDFARVAEAYGIAARTVSDPAEVASSLEWLWADPEAPALLEVTIDTFANVYPKLAFGYPITEMEPFVKPLAMEST